MSIHNSNLRKKLSDNIYVILGGIFAIILILCLIHIINNNIKENAKKAQATRDEIENTVTNISEANSNKTMIYGSNISSANQKIYSEVIENFINACNNRQIEKAYDMLAQESKEVLYNSNIELFKKNYVYRIFDTKKIYTIQAWISGKNPTYQIKIVQDMLSTGAINGKTIEDYYTIIRENDEYRLNINSFIGREQINKEKEQNLITIRVKYKDVYREYEEYKIEIQNNSTNTILMDSKESMDTVYLYGENSSKYSANTYEIDDEKLTLNPNEQKEIMLTVNKRYSNTNLISYMIWNDIILNKDEYENSQNKKEYINRISIQVGI